MLEKRVTLNKCEVVGEARYLQVRDAIEELEDGHVISESFDRRVLAPCIMRDGEWVPNPLDDEGDYVKGIADAAWDDAARDAFIKESQIRPPHVVP